MLKVRTSLFRVSGATNPLLRDQAHIANEDATVLAKDLGKQCRHDRCDEHPDEVSTIVVVAQITGLSTIRKDDFCCEAFAAKYDFALGKAPAELVFENVRTY